MKRNTNTMNLCPRCQHLKADGIPCGSPALRGARFCYTHQRVHRRIQILADHSCHVIPNLRSQRDIRVAATTILRDLRDGRIDLDHARVMAITLRLANHALKQRASLDGFQHAIRAAKNGQVPSFTELSS